MKNETKKFLEEGMKRYKQASLVMVSFIEELEALLQEILLKQKDWGPFEPSQTGKITGSTRNWARYPGLNARIKGKYGDKDSEVVLSIIWYESNTDYPFYTVSLSPGTVYTLERKNFDWDNKCEPEENRLRFDPDPNDFNPERDFKFLLNEYIRFLKHVEAQNEV